MKLQKEYYLNADVVLLARDLVGKILYTKIHNKITSGIIIETEAYNGVIDKASHAYNGRFTQRTATLYQQGGIAYVYLCYGIHHLLNIVTNKTEIPHAVLIRALEPLEGIPFMLKRRQKAVLDRALTRGPGSLSKAMGVTTEHDGTHLTGNKIWIEDQGNLIAKEEIISGPRIGVAYAEEDALLPYRFWQKGNPYVSIGK